jgi:hypothetical protein
MIVDYMETLGLVGRSFNAIYAINLFPLVIDKLFFRSHEASGKLEFLTEMLSLKGSNQGHRSRKDGFTVSEERKFLSLMHKKLMAVKFITMNCAMCIHFFQLLGLILFHRKVSKSLIASFSAMMHFVAIIIVEQNAVNQIFTLLVVCHITVDYFKARIRNLVSRIHKMAGNLTEQNVKKTVLAYDDLMFTFKKRNSSLRYLIRNMCYFYCPELSLVLFLVTIRTVWWLKIVILINSSTFISWIIFTEVYIGHLQSKVNNLYHQLNFAIARSAVGDNGKVCCFYTRMHLKMIIRELGSQRKDGQHMIGLTNGDGAAFTTADAVSLALTTCSFTILIMMNVYYT